MLMRARRLSSLSTMYQGAFAYATTIAGAQGRTVDRGHVLVTPHTMSAALYVGMTRGRDHNTAHVICDGHDHDEFGLGDRTAHQAFIEATRRDPDGQLTATTVRQRWEQAATERAANRANDRHHRHVSDWWHTRQQQLSPRVRTRIDPHHHRIIIATLERFTTDADRDSAVANALSLTDWRQPDAATKFVDLLKRHTASRGPTAATAAVRHTPQRDTTR